jgi:hypothetical protein
MRKQKVIIIILFCTSLVFAAAVPSQANPITVIQGEFEGGYNESSHTTVPFYMIGIYEPNNEHGWRVDEDGNYYHVRERGKVTVYLEEQSATEIVLSLGAYEPTDWIIRGPGADKVTRIVIHGYHNSTVTVQNSNPTVYNHTYEGNSIYCINEIYDWADPDRTGVVTQLEHILGVSLTAFSGFYNAESFHIDNH